METMACEFWDRRQKENCKTNIIKTVMFADDQVSVADNEDDLQTAFSELYKIKSRITCGLK